MVCKYINEAYERYEREANYDRASSVVKHHGSIVGERSRPCMQNFCFARRALTGYGPHLVMSIGSSSSRFYSAY